MNLSKIFYIIYKIHYNFSFIISLQVYKQSLAADYFFIAVLGFFMTGYLPIGFEFGAELTYPESEGKFNKLDLIISYINQVSENTAY